MKTFDDKGWSPYLTGALSGLVSILSGYPGRDSNSESFLFEKTV